VAPLKSILEEYNYKTRIGSIVNVRKDQMSKQIKVYLKLTGLGNMRPQDLRHSLASHLLMQGVDIKTVQQILGHTSPLTTSQVYAHVLKSHVKESISKLPY
jgi:site-specific recombinase XerD